MPPSPPRESGAERAIVVLGRARTARTAVDHLRASLGRGANVTAEAVLEVVPVTGRAAVVLATAARDLSDYDWVVFLSRPAVEEFSERVYECGSTPKVRAAHTTVAVVGEATAEVAEHLGWRVDLVSTGTAADTFASLAAHPFAPGGRVLVLRSSEAPADDPDLAPLHAVASVDVAIAYETRARSLDMAAWQERQSSAVAPVLVFLSASAVRAVCNALPVHSRAAWGARAVFVAMGPTTAAALADIGWRATTVADPPSLAGLCAAVMATA